MSAQRFLLSVLEFDQLFKIRDAVVILKEYGLSDIFLEEDVNAELEIRTQ